MNFRYDINGLRAIAVLAVVLFHFNAQWLPGGFAGVDVFFVISGFLMTAIIFNGIEQNTFSLFKFYNARANRIIPVLATMSIVLIVFGWYYLPPNDYTNLGRQIEKSSYFISNILFSKSSGYFDSGIDTKWLLHTWSLSVEWQFYIFFPLIVLILKKYLSPKQLRLVVFSLFLSSFIFCIYATEKNSKTAYFLLTSRAWEMLLGGLAFLYPWTFKHKLKQVITQCLGLILIIGSYFLVSKDTAWPGYLALVPVFGAYLILISHYQHNPLINNPLFNAIGKWSYSIYVWHWPLVVLGFYFAIENWWIYGIPLSILMGFLSYKFIEQIRFPRYQSWKQVYKVSPVYLALLVFMSGMAVKKTNGFQFHYPDQVIEWTTPHSTELPQKCTSLGAEGKLSLCHIGNSNNVKAIIVGDSHTGTVISSMTQEMDLEQEGLVSLATPGCPFIPNAHFNHSYDWCTAANETRYQYLAKHPDTPVVLANRYLQRMEGENDPSKQDKHIIYFADEHESKDKKYQHFKTHLEASVCDISKTSPVFIVSSIPEQGKNIPSLMSKEMMLYGRYNDHSISLSDYQQRSSRINHILYDVADKCQAKVLDPAAVLCSSGKCISQHQQQPLYSDGDHLNEYGSQLLKPLFKRVISL